MPKANTSNRKCASPSLVALNILTALPFKQNAATSKGIKGWPDLRSLDKVTAIGVSIVTVWRRSCRVLAPRYFITLATLRQSLVLVSLP